MTNESQDVEPNEQTQNQINDNLAQVRQLMSSACERVGRDISSVTLVAVTKYAQPVWVKALYQAGMKDFGENRPQQLVARRPQFAPDIRWHLIGQLQRNKVRPTLQNCDIIHSVDSIRLLDRIELIASELDVKPTVLLEVNVSGEASKAGFTPNDLMQSLDKFNQLKHLSIKGLMTMAPIVSTPEDARPTFAGLRKLKQQLTDEGIALSELSMGMSGDFEIAIEEGATLIRVGSRLYKGCE